MSGKNYSREKHPILPGEIMRCRENMRIGQQVTVRVREWDMDYRQQEICRKCVVEEKHRWLFVARDPRGKRYAVTWVEIIMQGGV